MSKNIILSWEKSKNILIMSILQYQTQDQAKVYQLTPNKKRS